MLTVTPEACVVLAQMLVDAEAPDEATVCLVIEDDGLSLVLGSSEEGDEVVTHDGRTVLSMSTDIGAALVGRTLDVEEGEDGPELGLK
jgi:hypothetical protein